MWITEESWKKALEKDVKLKELAQKAGVENDYKRAQELDGCYAWNAGKGVVKSEEEKELALYLFLFINHDDGGSGYQTVLEQRMLAARAASIGINDL